jgi:hypothetical protein
LFKELKGETGSYSLMGVISYAYQHLDRNTGSVFLKNLKPEDLTSIEYTLFRIRSRCLAKPEGFVDSLFSTGATIKDTDFVEKLQEGTEFWMPESEFLDCLEDTMTRENVDSLFGEFADIELDEYHVFNRLIVSCNDKIRMDLAYLRDLMQSAGAVELVSEEILE